MKKFVIYISMVLLGVVLIDLAVRAIFTFTYTHVPENAELRQRYKYELHNVPVEVLVVGGSRAMFCYDSSIIGDTLQMSIYNAGLDGGGVISQYLSVKKQKDLGGLKLVILDMDQLQLSSAWNQGKISNYYPYYWLDPDVKTVVDECQPQAHFFLRSALYQYNSCYHDIVRAFFEKSNNDQGHEALSYTGKVWTPDYWDEKREAFVPDSWAKKYLDKIVTLCKNANIQLVVTMAPGIGSGFLSSSLFLNSYCADHEIPFWDFTELKELHNDSRFFRDYNHLNSEGVKVFTPLLAHKLKKLMQEE